MKIIKKKYKKQKFSVTKYIFNHELKTQNFGLLLFFVLFKFLFIIISFIIEIPFFLFRKQKFKRTSTYFFFCRNENIIKIGFSNNVNKRKKQIEGTYKIELETLGVIPCNLEKSLHFVFKGAYFADNIIKTDWCGENFKYGTEWFTYSNKIKLFIEKI